MKQYVISYIRNPVTDINSTGYVKGIYETASNYVQLYFTNDPKEAQKFGVEVYKVVEWLGDINDTWPMLAVQEFAETVTTYNHHDYLGEYFVIDKTTRQFIYAPDSTSTEYWRGRDLTDRSKQLNIDVPMNELIDGESILQVFKRGDEVHCIQALRVKFN